MKKILVLSKYARLGASSRMRFMQYFPYLQASGFEIVHFPLISDDLLESRYKHETYPRLFLFKAYWRRIKHLIVHRNDYDLIWIQAELLPFIPYPIERFLLRKQRYVLDFDDAIFHNYDRSSLALVRWLFGRKLDGLMRRANLVVVGNDYLADRAVKVGAKRVEQLPTVVDLERYSSEPLPTDKPVIGWIGSPSTSRYLKMIEKALLRLSKDIDFEFWVIGGDYVNPHLKVRRLDWSEEREVECIRHFTVGVMPLLDSPWEQGKCGYKLIQYMACGKPVVASPIGVNREIIEQSNSGFCAETSEQWVEALKSLLENALLANEMGNNGRLAVETQYCLQVTSARLIELFGKLTNN